MNPLESASIQNSALDSKRLAHIGANLALSGPIILLLWRIGPVGLWMDGEGPTRAPISRPTVLGINGDGMAVGVAAGNAAIVSRIIKDTLEADFIKPYEEGQAKKVARYLPFWA